MKKKEQSIHYNYFVYSLESKFTWQRTDYYCKFCFSKIISFFCLEIVLAFIKWPHNVPEQVIMNYSPYPWIFHYI